MAAKVGRCLAPASRAANFSVKEKDEASPLRECAAGFVECLHSPICRGLEVFCFQALRWSLNRKPARQPTAAGQLKDQPMLKARFLVLALASLPFLSSAPAVTFSEDFSTDPLQNGWNVFGSPNLFQWDSANHQLLVTWDSTQPNSYFYYPLGLRLTRYDDFSFEFDLLLNDIATGVDAGKTGPLQIGIGFQNYNAATNVSVLRGYGAVSNIAEFCYYPHGVYDFGGGFIYDSPASVVPSFVSSTPTFSPNRLNPDYVLTLPTNQVMHIVMSYNGGGQIAAITVTTNGVPVGSVPVLVLNSPTNSNFTATDNYSVDVFSITSYTSIGDDFDSLLAHGTVDNLLVTASIRPIGQVTGGFSAGRGWQAQFFSHSNWVYTLERSIDFGSWAPVSATIRGTEGTLSLGDTNTLPARAFYRVRAEGF